MNFVNLIIFLLSFSITMQAVAEPPHSDFKFITIADIHFDPFIACNKQKPCPLIQKLVRAPVSAWPALFIEYDKLFSMPGQDATWTLLNSMLRAVEYEVDTKHPQFILLLGDYLAHNYRQKFKYFSLDNSPSGYQAFTKKTFQFLTNVFAQHFPTINIYPVIGNNDSYQGDYFVQPGGVFFRDIALAWKKLIKNSAKSSKSLYPQKDIQMGGYYALDLAGEKNLRLIVLNTILFSNKVRGGNVSEAASRELIWLNTELDLASKENKKVLIAMHIPKSIDMYIASAINLFTLMPFWEPKYSRQFQLALKDYSSKIVGIFSGHLHFNWSKRLSFNDNSKIPVFFISSVSPVYGNAPTFRVFTYSSIFNQFQNLQNYFLSIDKKWKEEGICERCI